MITIGSTRTKTRVINVATKFPGFIFTGYKNSKVISTVLTSHEDFQYMRNIYWTIQAEDRAKAAKIEEYNNTIPLNSTYGVPKLGLLIRLEDNVDKRTRQKLFNYIQVLVDGKFTLTINVADMIEVLNDLLVYIDWIFIIISVIAIFISFFFTVVAFTSNIKENILEFGVLRATGLNKKQMNLTYTFEALSLIIAAGILGTSVGIVIALLTSIQFHFYTELPLEFIFPTTVFLVTFGASLFTAVFGPKIAVDQVKNKQIANIIKALD